MRSAALFGSPRAPAALAIVAPMGGRGFTIVEVLLAIIVLTVGVLGLAVTAGLVTGMIARGERSALAARFAAQRLERLRTAACAGSAPESGNEILRRGTVAMASNNWRLSRLGARTWLAEVTTNFPGITGRLRSLRLETAVTC